MNENNNRRPELGDLNVPYEAMRARVWKDPGGAQMNYYAMNVWVGLFLFGGSAVIALLLYVLGIKW